MPDAAPPPVYALRQPPLVQPAAQSAFASHTRATYGVHDLSHEWVALFRAISTESVRS